MILNKYIKVLSTSFLLLMSNNIYSMEYNAAPHPINHNVLNNRSIDEVIQQNIELQKQLDLLNKQAKDMQEERKREQEDRKLEVNFKKILNNNTCPPQQYEPIQYNYSYNYNATKKSNSNNNPDYFANTLRRFAALNNHNIIAPNKFETRTDTIYLNNSQEFYNALHGIVGSFQNGYYDAINYEKNINYGKYDNYCKVFDNRVNSKMIPNTKKWIDYLESLSKECPIHDTRYDSVRRKIPSLLELHKEINDELKNYQELIKKIKVIDPIQKMIFDLSNTISTLQRNQIHEDMLRIEKRIKEYINEAYIEERELEKDLNELRK